MSKRPHDRWNCSSQSHPWPPTGTAKGSLCTPQGPNRVYQHWASFHYFQNHPSLLVPRISLLNLCSSSLSSATPTCVGRAGPERSLTFLPPFAVATSAPASFILDCRGAASRLPICGRPLQLPLPHLRNRRFAAVLGPSAQATIATCALPIFFNEAQLHRCGNADHSMPKHLFALRPNCGATHQSVIQNALFSVCLPL
jgi:hypothetical protein